MPLNWLLIVLSWVETKGNFPLKIAGNEKWYNNYNLSGSNLFIDIDMCIYTCYKWLN